MTLGFGMKVSEPGYDVKTAGDKNLSLKTGFTLLKVFSQGNKALSSSGFANTVSHSLGYVPQYLTFVKQGSNCYLAKGWFGTISLPVAIAKMDTSTLSIYKTGANLNAFYYIFYEPVDTGSAPSNVSTNHYGIKISKAGVSVESANILQQTFNSEKNSLKIVTDGTGTSTASGARDVNIAHGLSFIPGFLVYFQVDSSHNWFPDGSVEDLSGKNCKIDCFSDATNLTIQIYSDSSAAINYHYYILADPGENV